MKFEWDWVVKGVVYMIIWRKSEEVIGTREGHIPKTFYHWEAFTNFFFIIHIHLSNPKFTFFKKKKNKPSSIILLSILKSDKSGKALPTTFFLQLNHVSKIQWSYWLSEESLINTISFEEFGCKYSMWWLPYNLLLSLLLS